MTATKTRKKRAPKKAKANWGADEHPRRCPRCKSTDSTVVTTIQLANPARVQRYRKCTGDGCSQRYSTLEVRKLATE